MEAVMTSADTTGAIHPGEVLREDFLLPLSLTAYRLAKAVGMSESAVREILHGKRGITAATALRLARFFGTSPELWLNLQAAYELDAERARLAEPLEAIEPADLRSLTRERQRAVAARREPLIAALAGERNHLADELKGIQHYKHQEPEPAAV
jgi:addiction module HigA family antidote